MSTIVRHYSALAALVVFLICPAGHVYPAQQDSQFKHLCTISSLEGKGRLSNVQDVFWSKKRSRLLVTDTGGGRLLLFDQGEKSLRLVSEFKPEEMSTPVSAVETSDGKIIAVERNAPGVLIYDSSGAILRVLKDGFPDASSFVPTRLDLDEKDTLYVLDRGNRRICVFDANLNYRFQIAAPDSGGFSAFAAGKDNIVVALGSKNGTIYLFKDGKLARQFSGRGESRGETQFPVDVALDPQGSVYVVDSHGHRIAIFDRNGSFQGYIGEKGWKSGQFFFPVRIEISPDYRLFAVDADNGRLQVFQPARD
ncbi:MAG: NHL repeat-containing protein [Pseudomonadota bacterium]